LSSLATRIARGATAIALAAAAAPAAEAAGKKYALLVAINENHIEGGDLTKLEYAISDAEKLGALLVAQGFEKPRILTEAAAERTDIIRELNWYARKLDASDEFVLFYSGHGVRNSVINSQAYWMTYGAGISSLDASAIRLSHLVDYVREIKAEKKVILLDHCFSGDVVAAPPPPPASPPPGGAPPGPAPSPSPGDTPRDAALPPLQLAKAAQIVRGEIEKQVSGQGLVVLAAARNFAYESDSLKQGVFTKAVIDALESRVADKNPVDGKLSVTELVTHVSAFVSNFPPAGRQVPVLATSGVDLDRWVFAPNLPNPKPVVDPAALAALAIRVARYEQVLSRWHQKGYVTNDTIYKALALLRQWKRAEEDQARLADADASRLAKLLGHLDSVDQPEEGRGAMTDLLFLPGGN
jgi:uncharacterized caspase-like protein